LSLFDILVKFWLVIPIIRQRRVDLAQSQILAALHQSN